MAVKLKYLGLWNSHPRNAYRSMGHSPWEVDEVREVSDELAERLLRQFPGKFIEAVIDPVVEPLEVSPREEISSDYNLKQILEGTVKSVKKALSKGLLDECARALLEEEKKGEARKSLIEALERHLESEEE